MSGITLLKTDPFSQQSPSSSPSKCLIVQCPPTSPPPTTTSPSLSFPSATAFCQAGAALINDLINFLRQKQKAAGGRAMMDVQVPIN